MFKVNRREWSKTVIGGALMANTPGKHTYAVVGAGVFGAWTAYQLLASGHKVILIDEYGPSSSRASSGGESRIIRGAYGPDELYTLMAKRSLALWDAFFIQRHLNLLRRTGVLWMAKSGNAYVQQSREMLRKAGMPFQDLSTADLVRTISADHNRF